MKTVLLFSSIALLLISGGCGEPKTEPVSSVKLIVVDDTNFEELVLNSDKPVLVDFWATWCPPCKAIAPTVEEIAKEYEGRAVVAKLDIDKAPETKQQYGVPPVPTVIVFKDGKELSRVVGYTDLSSFKSELAANLDEALK
jgi:thioredoxin 1